jgi:hypothetical protein
VFVCGRFDVGWIPVQDLEVLGELDFFVGGRSVIKEFSEEVDFEVLSCESSAK